MTTQSAQPALEGVELRHLHYFAVVAEENSLRRAAERLFIAQPPLSRQIRQLEDRLGVALFERHSKGLTLTPEGEKALGIIRPLLEMRRKTFQRLKEEVVTSRNDLRIGFTTAFEQGIFTRLLLNARERHGMNILIQRDTSLKLVREIRKGRLDAALIALPLHVPDMTVRELPYAEPLVAAVPSDWPEAGARRKALPLKSLNGKPLFWFKREANPAYFDLFKARFAQFGYTPVFLEEPAEYDVLLARIAFGEGVGLLAASFATIRREGVSFIHLAEESGLMMRLGIISRPERAEELSFIGQYLRSSEASA